MRPQEPLSVKLIFGQYEAPGVSAIDNLYLMEFLIACQANLFFVTEHIAGPVLAARNGRDEPEGCI